VATARHVKFPQLWRWALEVSDGMPLSSYRWYTEPLHVCYHFATVLNSSFWLPPFWGRGAPRGSTVVQLDRTMVCSHRLLIETTVVTGIVWPNTASFDWGLWSPVSGKVWSKGLEMGPPCSLVVTSYRLAI